MDERGYKTHSGKLKVVIEQNKTDQEIYTSSKYVRYAVRIDERKEVLRPIWCVFNGFWWWNFEISISDRKIGKEIMSWRGRGCQNSTLRKLNEILDELETKPENHPVSKKTKQQPQTCEIPDLIIPTEQK